MLIISNIVYFRTQYPSVLLLSLWQINSRKTNVGKNGPPRHTYYQANNSLSNALGFVFIGRSFLEVAVRLSRCSNADACAKNIGSTDQCMVSIYYEVNTYSSN